MLRPSPHSSRTQGGDGRSASMLWFVGAQQASSASTWSSTVLRSAKVASRNRSTDSTRGAAPRNSGIAVVAALLARLRSQEAVLDRLTRSGLNWSGMRRRIAVGSLLSDGGGSNSTSTALVRPMVDSDSTGQLRSGGDDESVVGQFERLHGG